MNLPYTYTPYLWPMLASMVFSAALSFYGWRRHSVPGALPFAFLMGLIALWAMGRALGLSAVQLSTKIFWFKFQFFWQGPIVVAELFFVLEFAHLSRFLAHRTLTLLGLFILVGSMLIFTDELHHWIWQGFSFNKVFYPLPGVGYWFLISIGFFLLILSLAILVWLFIRSPRHRWPVAFILCGQFVVCAAFLVETASVNLVSLLDPNILAMNFSAMMYAVALFAFRIFDPIPLARRLAIEQMSDGILVLDNDGKIIDLNHSTTNILGLPPASVKGRDAAEVLPIFAWLSAGTPQTEIHVRQRYYELSLSPLKDRDNTLLGHLLLLHDVTVQKQAQAKVLEQQRALAMFSERERLARELHDGIGQVLGYVKLQAQAARTQLALDQKTAADSSLAQLVAVVQDTHDDIRDYILGTWVTASTRPGFLPVLQQHLLRFSEHYGLRAELISPSDWNDEILEPTVEAQLMRIIQEALTNARKHAQAQSVQVHIHSNENQIQVTIKDDGVGFEPARLLDREGQKYGLRFMRERAEEVGGSLEVRSMLSQGTEIVVLVPVDGSRGDGEIGKRGDGENERCAFNILISSEHM